MKTKPFGILLLRGLLGGAIGGFLIAAWSVLAQIELFKGNWDQWLFVFYLYSLPAGFGGGGVTALTIWLIHHYTHKNLGRVVRVIIGSLIAITGFIIFFLMTARATIFSIFSWSGLLVLGLLGLCFGGLPGLVVGRQQQQSKPLAFMGNYKPKSIW